MGRFKSSYPEHQVIEDWVCLHPSGAETVTGQSGVATYQEIPQNINAVMACLDLTNAGSLVGDTLDVFIQTAFPAQRFAGSGNYHWIDVVHFTQLLGTQAADVLEFAKIAVALDQAHFETVSGAALAAGAKRNVIGQYWRSRWVIADGGGTHAFTFEVMLYPMAGR